MLVLLLLLLLTTLTEKNDNGWDQGQVMTLPNASILSPYGVCNSLLKQTWQPLVLKAEFAPPSFTNTTQLFALMTRNETSISCRVVNFNSTKTLRVDLSSTLAANECLHSGAMAQVLTMRADSTYAVNTPAKPDNVAVREAPPLPITAGAFVFSAPAISISVVTAQLIKC